MDKPPSQRTYHWLGGGLTHKNFILRLAHGTLNLRDLDNLHQFSCPLEVTELRASHLSLQQLTKIAGTNSFQEKIISYAYQYDKIMIILNYTY